MPPIVDWRHVSAADFKVPTDRRLPDLTAELTELLAKNAHDVWARLRLAQGWRWGPARNDAAKEHPSLVPYEALPESEKQADRDTVIGTLQAIRALGKKTGVSLNPATPESAIEYVLDLVDLVLVMSVNPGFGGQAFIDGQVEKIARIRQMTAGRDILIEVDGGVTPHTAPRVAAAGADVLVAGSAVFKGGVDYAGRIASIREAAETARGTMV